MSDDIKRVRPQPCEFCPYRKDVPSGVWAASCYDLLPPYDEGTMDQPYAVFCCHTNPDHLCHGWAVVHSNRGSEFDLLSLRLRMSRTGVEEEIPEAAVPLFESGTEAAEHGMADIEHPSPEAIAAVEKLTNKHERLRFA